MYRTHTCGCLRAENVNQTVTLAGWVQKVRNLGAMTFIDLRDRYGITQVVIEEHSPAEARQTACCVGREWVIQVVGKVIERQSKNPRMATGDIEVAAQKVTILHEAEVPPFTIEEVSDGGDDLRMKYRYLDLRRPPLQRNMILRHKMAQEIRRFLDAEGFLEIETPYLVNSTPEGARDFVVPSRMNPNQFYALPQSPQTLKQLGMLVILFYASVLVFVFGVLGLVMRLSGFSLIKLLRYLREELAIVFATTSSDSVLPQIMAKLRHMGIRDSTVGLVIPTGYSFNLDAFSIYITLAAVFIAQATNTPISMADLLTILAIALVTSKGAHGVPGSAIVVLAATLHAIPAIPAIGLVLVLSVDWFMGIARALGNLIGNCVATVAIAAWEGDIDRERAHAVLDGRYVPEDETSATLAEHTTAPAAH